MEVNFKIRLHPSELANLSLKSAPHSKDEEEGEEEEGNTTWYHAAYARERGIILADTKFEFGARDGEYLLIDEIFTPDSSRFWPADKYEPGRDQESFDKQYVRNYLTTLVESGTWDKTPPGPELPDEIVANTAAKYREALTRLTE